MNSAFSKLHPIINIFYFTSVFIFTLLFNNPVFVIISFVCAVIYSVHLNGLGKYNATLFLTVLIYAVFINPLINHRGVTILFYINYNPITLESFIHGIVSAVMFLTVIIWFASFNVIMTSEKIIYLFGRIIPSAALIFSMTLRFIPRFKTQLKEISNAQKGMGKGTDTGSVFVGIKNGMKILSVLFTWAFENAIDTADSMKSRGYGTARRSNFHMYRFSGRDCFIFIVLSFLILINISGYIMDLNTAFYYPMFRVKLGNIYGIINYSAFLLLCLFPLLLELWEDVKWRHIQLKT